jgi:Fe-S oxidoreductase
MTTIDKTKLSRALASKASARLEMWLSICSRCGLCAEGCHYYASNPRTEHVPAYRIQPLLDLYRRRGKVDAELLTEFRDIWYGTCTMCQRCTMYCPHGIGIAPLVHAARGVAVAMGLTPPGLAKGLENALEFGNNLGMTEDEYLETVEWQLEELREEMPSAEAPMDKAGAEYLLTFHPRDIKFYPQNLYNYLKLYNASGIDFTLSSKGWDSTNLGLFAGDVPKATALAKNVVEAAEALRVKALITAE